MRRRIIMTAALVLIFLCAVGMQMWTSGRFSREPTPGDKAAFARMLMGHVAQDYGVPVTIESVDARWGDYGREQWPLEFFTWRGYQYVVRWRVVGTDARWVEVYPPGTPPDSLASTLDSDTVSAIVAFDELSRSTLRGTVVSPLEGSGLKVPAGSTVYELNAYDSKSFVDFYGQDYYLVRTPQGRYSLLRESDTPPDWGARG